MLDFGAPKHLVWLLKSLYDNSYGMIRVDQQHTDKFRFERGVRQGCPLSPLLFLTCGEDIMRSVEAELPDRTGAIVGGRALWNLRYADDTALLARSRTQLEQEAQLLKKHSERFELQINSSKTVAMAISEQDDRQSPVIEGATIKSVQKFKYLGSLVTAEGKCELDIRARLAMARNATLQLVEVWRSKEISLHLKKRLMKSLIWSIASYGSESWTLKKADERRICAFELWAWRRLLRISWRQRKTNEWVREIVRVPESEGLLQTIKRRKQQKYGHWKRRPDSVVMMTTEGEVEGRARRGRRRKAWIDDLRETPTAR